MNVLLGRCGALCEKSGAGAKIGRPLYTYKPIAYPGMTTSPHGAASQDGSPLRRQALGEFVRSARSRITPQMAGLPEGMRRRTPGLRREEVAQLCGISVTWYTWIEQGREVSVSASALARLANGLRLSRAERSYLFEVGGKRDPE